MEKKPIITAANGHRPLRTPVWFLRQAGRYLPEYQQVRKNYNFIEMCHNPKVVTEVTLQPLRRYDLDAAIIFSDILLICESLGQKLSFEKDHGPQLTNPVRTSKDVARLLEPNIGAEFSFLAESIALVKSALAPHQAMIGFAGAPFTVASYMVEGKGSKDYQELKKFCYCDPQGFAHLLDVISESTFELLKVQVDAGAEVLMLFDSWAGQLSPDDYERLVFPVMEKLFSRLKRELKVPLIYYPGQGVGSYPRMGEYAIDVVHIDWRLKMSYAISLLTAAGSHTTVQGNFDPQIFVAPEPFIRERVRSILEQAGQARAHIFNVGHGLVPSIHPDAVTIAVDEVRRFDKSK